MGRMQNNVNFLADSFEFRDFILLDYLPLQGERVKSTLLFPHSWGKNSWIRTVPKRTSAI